MLRTIGLIASAAAITAAAAIGCSSKDTTPPGTTAVIKTSDTGCIVGNDPFHYTFKDPCPTGDQYVTYPVKTTQPQP